MGKVENASRLEWVTDKLAVGSAPMSYEHLDMLRAQGIVAILNLCGEFCDLHEIEAEAGFEVYYLPITDEEAPPLDELEKALAWLDESLYLGKKVLIHCRMGMGRTGAVLNAYYLRRGLSASLAGKKIRGTLSRPSSFSQWWALKKYARRMKPLAARPAKVEFKRSCDLEPWFTAYAGLAAEVEDRLAASGPTVSHCGNAHDRCCREPFRLRLIEAAAVARALDQSLPSQERSQRMAKAGQPSDPEAAAFDPASEPLCILSENGACRIFASRPLRCRISDLPEEERGPLWRFRLEPVLEDLSRKLAASMASGACFESIPDFSMAEAVSGKYVPALFHLFASKGS